MNNIEESKYTMICFKCIQGRLTIKQWWNQYENSDKEHREKCLMCDNTKNIK